MHLTRDSGGVENHQARQSVCSPFEGMLDLRIPLFKQLKQIKYMKNMILYNHGSQSTLQQFHYNKDNDSNSNP